MCPHHASQRFLQELSLTLLARRATATLGAGAASLLGAPWICRTDDLSHALSSATRLVRHRPERHQHVCSPPLDELATRPPPVLALCCQLRRRQRFAGQTNGVRATSNEGAAVHGARSKVSAWAALFTVGTRVVLHGLKADLLNLRHGTVVTGQTAEDRVGVRLDAN